MASVALHMPEELVGREPPEQWQNGAIDEYSNDRIFGSILGSLRALIARKRALADETRYSILYLLYETNFLGRTTLVNATGLDGEGLENHLRKLLDANLIARVPTPDGIDGRRTFYRITELGRQEIKSDLRNLHDPITAENRFSCQKELGEWDAFRTSIGGIESGTPTNPGELADMRHNIRYRSEGVAEETDEVVIE